MQFAEMANYCCYKLAIEYYSLQIYLPAKLYYCSRSLHLRHDVSVALLLSLYGNESDRVQLVLQRSSNSEQCTDDLAIIV